MKLFKKLAAAVLAAALALTMVGCGGGNSYAMQDELLKITIDNLTDVNETVTHTKKADEMAAAIRPPRRRQTTARMPRNCCWILLL